MTEISVTDVTSKTLREFNENVPDGRSPAEAQRKILLPNNTEWPLPTWNPSRHADYHYFDDPPVDEQTGQLRFVSRSLHPDTMEFVFEISGIDVPKLIAVSWPIALLPRKNTPIPFLVYYRPEPIPSPPGVDRFGPTYLEICHRRKSPPDKGCSVYNLKPYPWNWDFLFYVFWNYLNYRSDPLTYKDERWRFGKANQILNNLPLRETDEKFSFGLPYQIQAAGKPLVLVLPMANARTFGKFDDATVVQATLEAIQNFVFQQFDVQPAPSLEWVALAGYSKSNKTIGRFLSRNKHHVLVAKTVKEVYLFDPAPAAPSADADIVDAAIHSVKAWALRGTGFKAIRAYASQKQFPAFADILGDRLPVKAAFRDTRLGVQVGNTNRFQTFPWSVAWLPSAAWIQAQTSARKADYLHEQEQLDTDFANAETLDQTQNAFNQQWALKEQQEYDKHNTMGGAPLDVHLALAAMCLTDAARRNGFNYTPYAIPKRRFAGVDATTPRKVLAGI